MTWKTNFPSFLSKVAQSIITKERLPMKTARATKMGYTTHARRLFNGICVLLLPFSYINTVVAAELLVSGPNARITGVNANWNNEGRFAVYIVGGAPGTPCAGWVFFNPSNLSSTNQGAHKLNYAAALAAMTTKQRVEIQGATVNCWDAIGIATYNN